MFEFVSKVQNPKGFYALNLTQGFNNHPQLVLFREMSYPNSSTFDNQFQ